MAGFECSCHLNSCHKRLDMMAAVGHDRYVAEDYARLREVGIATARDGVRWHLIERAGCYDWSSWIPMLRAAREAGVQVIWDLCHYGWPDGLDIFSAAFVERFARFAGQAAQVQREHGEGPFTTNRPRPIGSLKTPNRACWFAVRTRRCATSVSMIASCRTCALYSARWWSGKSCAITFCGSIHRWPCRSPTG